MSGVPMQSAAQLNAALLTVNDIVSSHCHSLALAALVAKGHVQAAQQQAHVEAAATTRSRYAPCLASSDGKKRSMTELTALVSLPPNEGLSLELLQRILQEQKEKLPTEEKSLGPMNSSLEGMSLEGMDKASLSKLGSFIEQVGGQAVLAAMLSPHELERSEVPSATGEVDPGFSMLQPWGGDAFAGCLSVRGPVYSDSHSHRLSDFSAQLQGPRHFTQSEEALLVSFTDVMYCTDSDARWAKSHVTA